MHQNISPTSRILQPQPPSSLKISIGVWNMQGHIPEHNQIKKFIDNFTEQQQKPDLICVSTQECERSINMSYFCEGKQNWENCLKEMAIGYVLVQSNAMNAMSLVILVKKQNEKGYFTLKKKTMPAGKLGCLGNKGAISILGNLFGQNFQFVNCHLAANQNQTAQRNTVLIKIAKELVDKDYRNQVFICGDLNYRIEMTNAQYQQLVSQNHNTDQIIGYSNMLQRDQLKLQPNLISNFLPFYEQFSIDFAPSYKLSKTTEHYSKNRIPGWTDRIFHRRGRAKQLKYQCLNNILGSDHRPVVADFVIETDETFSVSTEKFWRTKNQGNCALI